LTDNDKATILGCSNRFSVEQATSEWVPELLHSTEFDRTFGVDVGTVYINLGIVGDTDDVAIVRLLDDLKSPRKMYTVKWYRRDGKISISESTRTRSFFFENDRDAERASIDDIDTLSRMQQGYVGFWIQYRFDTGVNGGQISVGLNGAPFSPDYALLKWSDTSGSAMRSVAYMGFTAEAEAKVNYGTNCILLNTQIGLGQNPFVQIQPQQNSFSSNNNLATVIQRLTRNGGSGLNLNQIQPQFNFASLGRNPGQVDQVVQRQVVPPGAKPWERRNQGLAPMELEIVTEPEQTILEPVLRNQYLTKLKRLLPTFFEDFNRGEIESILLGAAAESSRQMKQNHEDQQEGPREDYPETEEDYELNLEPKEGGTSFDHLMN
jgi:hypothetical protein